MRVLVACEFSGVVRDAFTLVATSDARHAMSLLPKSESQRIHHLSPSPDRWRERSRTFAGIAEAMADQWGREELRAA